MKFTLLGNVYDDQNDLKIRHFFVKAVRWIQESSEAARENWKKILAKRYRQYLVEGSSDNILLESQCEGCSGACGTCYVKKDKGEIGMNLERRFNEAFGPYQRPQSEENLGFAMVHQIIDGKLVQTKHSKFDEAAYWQDQEKEETIEESGLSLDEQFKEAFK